jgi:cytoplasmic iron level regulating protein YaaA (DUF328/UPF0246 family)
LVFSELAPARRTVADSLVALCADLPAARAALGVSAGKDAELTATAELAIAPTTEAVQRYTGVLYGELDVGSLRPAARQRARERVLIASALFGVVGAADGIPAYRLSASSRLPGIPSLATFWRPVLGPALAALPEPVLDLRSGAYAALAPLPGAVTVRVTSVGPSGARTVVSHWSKAAKGRLARALLASRAEVDDARAVVRVAGRAGLRIERTGPSSLELLT